jgi:hypothetical protein
MTVAGETVLIVEIDFQVRVVIMSGQTGEVILNNHEWKFAECVLFIAKRTDQATFLR